MKAKPKAEPIAKVHAVAKATYSRKRTTTEIIPPDVTRAKAGAWLTLISPFTEWAGLRGDQLRHKRELLRIQQEASLAAIAQNAKKQIELEGQDTKPVPNKFLVPFLEKASLEDADSELIITWASLLASAATNFNPHMTRFCSLLSEVGVEEIKLLHRMCREARGRAGGLARIEDAPIGFSATQLTRSVNRSIDVSQDVEENVSKIIEENELPGGLFLVLGLSEGGGPDFESAHDLDDRQWEGSISLLQSLGILDNQMFISGDVEHFSWYGESVSLTAFGVAFVRACDREVREAFRESEAWIREQQDRQADIEDLLRRNENS